jgi:hypothetical protein
MQLDLFKREQIGASGKTKVCARCNVEKPVEAFRLYRRATGDRESRDSKCKECSKYQFDVANELRKTAPEYQGFCECCGKECEKPVLDHCHDTEKFRGWLCSPCNLGIGVLGDNLESLEKTVVYLKKAEYEQH